MKLTVMARKVEQCIAEILLIEVTVLSLGTGQQHLTFSEQDLKENLRRKSGAITLFLKANTFTQINIAAQGKSCLAQYIQVQRRKILPRPETILSKITSKAGDGERIGVNQFGFDRKKNGYGKKSFWSRASKLKRISFPAIRRFSIFSVMLGKDSGAF